MSFSGLVSKIGASVALICVKPCLRTNVLYVPTRYASEHHKEFAFAHVLDFLLIGFIASLERGRGRV
jgi:hypothetical protein